MALRHSVVPFFRKDTSTLALRLSSPVIGHSNPRLMSVGGSITISPGVTERLCDDTAAWATAPRLRSIARMVRQRYGAVLGSSCFKPQPLSSRGGAEPIQQTVAW